MKKLLKMSLLGFVLSIAITSCNGCGADGKKPPETIDTGKIDTAKADVSRVQNDTAKMDTVKTKGAAKK